MAKVDITILTDDRYVAPITRNDYINNILLEDGAIGKALEDEGFSINRISWSDPAYDWSQSPWLLFRSTWDYFDRFEEFMKWMKNTSTKSSFINSYRLAQWNLDKHYLQDLQKKGIPVVPTKFIEKSTETTLAKEAEDISGEEFILKPVISGAGRHTYRILKSNNNDYEELFQRLIGEEAMMIQPFIESVLTRGEISLMIMGGEFTHAVLKIAKPGDFRVQDDFGGTVHPYDPDPEEIELAEKVIKCCPERPLYARVDIVWDGNDAPLIGEVELIEPELFFRNKPQSANVLAKSIRKFIDSKK